MPIVELDPGFVSTLRILLNDGNKDPVIDKFGLDGIWQNVSFFSQ